MKNTEYLYYPPLLKNILVFLFPQTFSSNLYHSFKNIYAFYLIILSAKFVELKYLLIYFKKHPSIWSCKEWQIFLGKFFLFVFPIRHYRKNTLVKNVSFFNLERLWFKILKLFCSFNLRSYFTSYP